MWWWGYQDGALGASKEVVVVVVGGFQDGALGARKEVVVVVVVVALGANKAVWWVEGYQDGA